MLKEEHNFNTSSPIIKYIETQVSGIHGILP